MTATDPLTHVVLMKFHNRGDAAEAAARLTPLADSVPGIESLTVALDELATPVSYDLVLTTTHSSSAELVAYQQHPAHRAVGEWLAPRLAARAVVDYRDQR
ncbi:Dabb family protein [Nocardia sp. NPDC051321]|uniref:Dabb family protein n=1 Tax=Nocardia sp. NPDC051321 TaxID=3364323 RepID=UPI0037B8DB62